MSSTILRLFLSLLRHGRYPNCKSSRGTSFSKVRALITDKKRPLFSVDHADTRNSELEKDGVVDATFRRIYDGHVHDLASHYHRLNSVSSALLSLRVSATIFPNIRGLQLNEQKQLHIYSIPQYRLRFISLNLTYLKICNTHSGS